MLLAYRAILAEPRSKSTATEDYSSGGAAARNDYAGGSESMNQYTLGTSVFVIRIYYHRKERVKVLVLSSVLVLTLVSFFSV